MNPGILDQDSFFFDLTRGLEEAIAHARGVIDLQTRNVTPGSEPPEMGQPSSRSK